MPVGIIMLITDGLIMIMSTPMTKSNLELIWNKDRLIDEGHNGIIILH